jgi:hypothetical protein
MTPDIELQFANNPVLRGRGNVSSMFDSVFSKLDSMTHEVNYYDYVAPRIYQSARIRYLAKGDDPETQFIEIPGFAVFWVKVDGEGKIKCYRAETYLDPSTLFQRIQDKELQLGRH